MPGLHIRRARRTDFSVVMELMARAETPLPPPDRRTLRRFRQIVADLGGDFYLAFDGDQLVGLVHVTYTRLLAAPPRAHLDQLLVGESARRRGVGSALLALARQRARKRGCTFLSCSLPSGDTEAQAFSRHAGLRPAGETLLAPLQPIA